MDFSLDKISGFEAFLICFFINLILIIIGVFCGFLGGESE